MGVKQHFMGYQMKSHIFVFAVVCGVAAPALSQELRKPTEVISFVEKSTYPVNVYVEVGTDSKFYVWYNLRAIGDKAEFMADKFETYERDKRTKEIYELKDIPHDRTLTVQNVPGMTWPRGGGSEYDNKITYDGVPPEGFPKDFVVGPFNYTVIWSRALGVAKNGLLYISAEIETYTEKPTKGKLNRRRLRMLYKVNMKAKIVDSFASAEATYLPRKAEEGSRYPWEWRDSGSSYIDNKGDFYNVIWTYGHPRKDNIITIRKWSGK